MIVTKGLAFANAHMEICPKITSDHNPIMLMVRRQDDRGNQSPFSFPTASSY